MLFMLLKLKQTRYNIQYKAKITVHYGSHCRRRPGHLKLENHRESKFVPWTSTICFVV